MADTVSSNSVHMEKGWGALRQHIIDNKIKAALWVTRLFTIIFTIGYIIQIFGYVILNFCFIDGKMKLHILYFSNPYNIYYKILMNNAATSALRLHQRVPHVQLNRQFLERLFVEDSCHYLLYSLIFLYTAPVTCILFNIINRKIKYLYFYTFIICNLRLFFLNIIN